MRAIQIRASRNYEVLVEPGLLDCCGPLISCATGSRRALVVAGDIVAPLYADRLLASLERAGIEASLFVLPHGEQNKTLDNYEKLLLHISSLRLGRSDALIALGGGVTGDLTGFAAATYQRGMVFVQVPTTLLAAIDSSVGGKTAVDLPGGKNQVGCFYQPWLVLCDPDTLSTLPPEELRCGLAEAAKYAVLGSRELYQCLIEGGAGSDLEDMICRCVEMKRDIIARDEFDLGLRQMLNLGHTIAHGIEACSQFSVLHGQAVSIGLAVIARAACSMGFCSAAVTEQILALLERLGLPTATEYSLEQLYQAALLDKKIRSGSLDLVVPEDIGRCRLVKIKTAELRQWMQAGGIRP